MRLILTKQTRKMTVTKPRLLLYVKCYAKNGGLCNVINRQSTAPIYIDYGSYIHT